MHGSGSSLKETATIWLYLDESGGPDTQTAVMGGMLIAYPRFHSFEENWADVLERHGIPWPLHMTDFSKDGPLGTVTNTCRFELFSELIELINENKLLSLVGKIRTDDFSASVDEFLQGHFGLYGMNFTLLAVMNTKLAANSGFDGVIPYVLDDGNSKNHHVVAAHSEIRKMQREEPEFNWRSGGLHFENDRDFALLQASDLIAWAARRKEDTGHLPRGMEPMWRIFRDENKHCEKYFEPRLMKEMSDKIMTAHRQRLEEQNENKEYE